MTGSNAPLRYRNRRPTASANGTLAVAAPAEQTPVGVPTVTALFAVVVGLSWHRWEQPIDAPFCQEGQRLEFLVVLPFGPIDDSAINDLKETNPQ